MKQTVTNPEPNIDASFIAPFLVDEELLNKNPSSHATDLAKKVVEVFDIMNDDPERLTEQQVRDIVWDPSSQIGVKGPYWAHIVKTGKIYSQMVEALLSKHPELDLPSPKNAWARGIIHDLSATYAKYGGEYKQHDKEVTMFFHARHLGVPVIADEIALHNGYMGIFNMIAEGAGFEGVELYADWTAALNRQQDVNGNANPLSYTQIVCDFADFSEAKANLPLMVLSVADNLDDPSQPNQEFNLEELDSTFETRLGDIIFRYSTQKRIQDKPLTAFGQALTLYDDVERMVAYKVLVKDLLLDEKDFRESLPGIYKQ